MILFVYLVDDVVIVWCEIDLFYLLLFLLIERLYEVLFYETMNFAFLLISSLKQ